MIPLNTPVISEKQLMSIKKRKKILVLEDEESILELIEILLTGEGYDVMTIDHHEPLEYLMDFEPELILMDIRLSNGYGHNLCKDFKANAATASIPVILVSGSNNLEKIAKESNADGYLAKPFENNDLLDCVKRYN